MFTLYFVDSSHAHTPCARSIHRPPCAGFLHFLISIRLLLTPLYHGQIFPVFSRCLPLLLSTFLSVSLFRDCSGWSPCGAPCRVPNLFIISALCQDARGMLKYTPPHSGYKWAAAWRAVFPLTRPRGQTCFPTHTPLDVPSQRRPRSRRIPAALFLLPDQFSANWVIKPELYHAKHPHTHPHTPKLCPLAGCLEGIQPRGRAAVRRLCLLTDTC